MLHLQNVLRALQVASTGDRYTEQHSASATAIVHVDPRPATQAILVRLKAGESVYCIFYRAYKTLSDSI